MPARELRPVVTANCFRQSAFCNDPIPLPRHSPARKTRVHFQCQTFPPIHLDHAQHAELPSPLRCIVHKIQSPFLVRSRHHRTHNTRSHQAFSSSPPNQQPRFPVYPIHFLVVHVHPFRLQLHLQPPVSPLRLLSRRRNQPFPYRFIVPPT